MKTFAFDFGFLADLTQRVSSLRRDQRGVSAVEFAMVLPLMVTLYFGAVEISTGVGIQRKVTLVARTVADLAAQVTTINNNDMNNLLNAAAAVMAPLDSQCQLKVTVSAVDIDTNGVAKVAWSDTRNGTARGVNSTVTVPTALNVPDTQLIWGEVSCNYLPTVGYVVTGALNLFDQMYMRPRLSEKVQRTTS
jgi:Flp pilus assembly protein TadG